MSQRNINVRQTERHRGTKKQRGGGDKDREIHSESKRERQGGTEKWQSESKRYIMS